MIQWETNEKGEQGRQTEKMPGGGKRTKKRERGLIEKAELRKEKDEEEG